MFEYPVQISDAICSGVSGRVRRQKRSENNTPMSTKYIRNCAVNRQVKRCKTSVKYIVRIVYTLQPGDKLIISFHHVSSRSDTKSVK